MQRLGRRAVVRARARTGDRASRTPRRLVSIGPLGTAWRVGRLPRPAMAARSDVRLWLTRCRQGSSTRTRGHSDAGDDPSE